MFKSKVLVSFIILVSMLFFVFHFNESYWRAEVCRSLIVPFITLLYFFKNKHKSIYFTFFLVAFSIADIIFIFGNFVPIEMEYYLGNALYIAAYIALSYEIVLSIDMKYVFKYFKTHLFVLLVLNIYANYVLLGIVKEYEFLNGLELSFEIIYNISTLILLSVSLLNYFYRDDKKAFVIFLGTLCIVVSEVIQIAYYYIPEVENNDVLGISYSFLLILAFFFYYSQSKLDYEEVLGLA